MEPRVRVPLEPFGDRPPGIVEPAEVDEPGGAKAVLPGGTLEPLTFGTDRQDGRPGFGRMRDTMLSGLEEDERSRGRLELLVMGTESRAAPDDHVELLVGVLVLFDDEVARLVAAVGVDAERVNPERVPDGLSPQRAVQRRQRLDLVEVDALHAGRPAPTCPWHRNKVPPSRDFHPVSGASSP
jgi:hypothetical protein